MQFSKNAQKRSANKKAFSTRGRRRRLAILLTQGKPAAAVKIIYGLKEFCLDRTVFA
jgi:hypothetical protein